MATNEPVSKPNSEKLDLRAHAWPAYRNAMITGAVCLIWAVMLGFLSGDNFRRFFFAYLSAYCYFLTLTLGALFFVLIQHLTRAGWSVNVRRIAEWMAASMPLMAALSAPIIISILIGDGGLYPWANSAHRALMPHFKQMYLNPFLVIGRLAICFAAWSAMGLWYWKQSTLQDATGDLEYTRKMQSCSAICMVIFALTLTSAAFDLLMSVDPYWYSTIFGVYIFAGSVIAIHAAIVLICLILQSKGYLRQSITVEHYHDLGKFMFAFVFFWGYVAFSQYMLQWYGNIPEEVNWFIKHGASTSTQPGAFNGWNVTILVLLFCHVLIPFAGLMSRHIKRNRATIGFWAVWLLLFHWLDMFWIVRPEMNGSFDIGFIDLAVMFGIGGVYVAVVLRKAGHDALRPIRDPRVADSLALENL